MRRQSRPNPIPIPLTQMLHCGIILARILLFIPMLNPTSKHFTSHDSMHSFYLPNETAQKTDQDLVKELDSSKKPFFLIRTNIDNDLPRRRNRNKENEILEKIRQNTLKILANRENGDSEKKLFLISNRDPEKWEFGRLKTAILYELQQSGVKPTSASEKTQNCTDEEIKQIDKSIFYFPLLTHYYVRHEFRCMFVYVCLHHNSKNHN